MKKNKLFSILGAVAISATFFTSCETEQPQDKQDQEFAKVAEKLENLGFNVDQLQKTEFNGKQGYAVEGDIFLTLAQINEMAPAGDSFQPGS